MWRRCMYLLFCILAIGGISEACTATSTLARAEQMAKSEDYLMVKTAVARDITEPLKWEIWESTESATGTAMLELMLRRAIYREAYASVDAMLELLYKSAVIRHVPGHLVRDHAMLHGGEWESGYWWWSEGRAPLPASWYSGKKTQKKDLSLYHAG